MKAALEKGPKERSIIGSSETFKCPQFIERAPSSHDGRYCVRLTPIAAWTMLTLPARAITRGEGDSLGKFET